MLFKLINKLPPDYLVHHLWNQNTQNYDLRRMSQKIQIRELPHIAIFFPATIRETGIVFPKTFYKPDQSRVLKNYSNTLMDKRLIPFTLLDGAMKKLPTPDFDLNIVV